MDSSNVFPASEYFQRIGALAESYRLLAGIEPSWSADLSRLSACHRTLPPYDRWRDYSRLCVDGAPVELVETLRQGAGALSINCDGGPYGASAAERLDQAVGLAASQWPEIQSLRRILFPPHVAAQPFSLWLGFSAEGTKLYWNLAWRETPDAWRRALAALELLNCRPDAEAESLLRDVARQGYLKMLALDRRNRGVSAKIYYRLTQPPDRPEFAAYRRRLLGITSDWSDPNTGIAVQLGSTGELQGVALYHYCAPYFRDDGELRRRVIAQASAFGWQTDVYRLTSRLIDERAHGPLRRLAAFSCAVTGVTQLHLYATTGYLARNSARQAA
jgi:hypothetical protein